MPVIIGGSKSLALSMQRNLSAHSESVGRSFNRLSSGLRINSAADDAAGLSVATTLNSSKRIYSRAILNINDGISAVNIGEGALSALSNITIRQRELATQAANGSLSLSQRQAINTEARALTDEYNRLVQSTSLNNISLLNGVRTTAIQVGDGRDVLSVNFADELARIAGTGNFSLGTTFAATSLRNVETGDVNNDGNADMIWAITGNNFYVALGNGDGSFKSSTSWSSAGAEIVKIADFNSDGKLDVANIVSNGGSVRVSYGNGDGTFKANISYVTGLITSDFTENMSLADFNNDGRLDILAYGGDFDDFSVMIANSDGSFKVGQAVTISTGIDEISTGDLNGDGYTDLLIDITGSSPSIYYGNNNGTFRVGQTISLGNISGSSISDIDNDGDADIVSNFGATVRVALNNGDGTFLAATSLSATNANGASIHTQDLDGDGIQDILTSSFSFDLLSVFIGNGDGTFKAIKTFFNGNSADSAYQLSFGDFNNDGALEVIQKLGSSFVLFNPETQAITTQERFNMNSAAGAREAMSKLDATLTRINLEQGSLGAFQSRLTVAQNNLRSLAENYSSAESRIMDVDVAEESAALIRSSILQKVNASLMQSFNVNASLVLDLLR